MILLGTIGFLGAQVLGGLGPDASPTPTPERADRAGLGRATRSPASEPMRSGSASILDERPPEPSDTVPVDRVIRTDPEADTPDRAGRTPSASWSARATEQVPVPNLIGQTRHGGDRHPPLQADLQLGLVTSENSDRPAGDGDQHQSERRRAGGRREPGRPGPLARTDAVAEPVADAGADAEPHARAADADAAAVARSRRACDGRRCYHPRRTFRPALEVSHAT